MTSKAKGASVASEASVAFARADACKGSMETNRSAVSIAFARAGVCKGSKETNLSAAPSSSDFVFSSKLL